MAWSDAARAAAAEARRMHAKGRQAYTNPYTGKADGSRGYAPSPWGKSSTRVDRLVAAHTAKAKKQSAFAKPFIAKANAIAVAAAKRGGYHNFYNKFSSGKG